MKGHGHISRACTGRICHVCGALPETNFLKTDNHRFRGYDLLEQFPPPCPAQMGPADIQSGASRMLGSRVHFNIVAQSYYTVGIVGQIVGQHDRMRVLPPRVGVHIMGQGNQMGGYIPKRPRDLRCKTRGWMVVGVLRVTLYGRGTLSLVPLAGEPIAPTKHEHMDVPVYETYIPGG